MPSAMRVHQVGGPEQLRWEPVELPPPGAGEVRLAQTAVGVNFIDVYHRTGLYPQPAPFVLGQEGAGVVAAVGAGVTSLREGDRVAYAMLPGAYAEQRNAPVARLLKLPAGISDELAASVMLKGMTAEFLVRRCPRALAKGDVVLLHAAAGGVGQLAAQWARALGATVIGVVGRAEKAAVARAAGCEHVLVSADDDFVARARELTGGRGVDVAYDSVGRDTLSRSLDCLKVRGLLVSFGQSSGPPPPLELARLGGPRSLFVTRPSLHAYVSTREDLEASAAALFDVLTTGAVKVAPPTRFALRDAADAHRALEARETTGSLVLTV